MAKRTPWTDVGPPPGMKKRQCADCDRINYYYPKSAIKPEIYRCRSCNAKHRWKTGVYKK